METVQEKLQECVEKGSMNSFERISKLLGSNSDSDMEEDSGSGIKMPTSTSKPLVGKNPDKLPATKFSVLKRSKIRGQKKGMRVYKRTSTKKNSGKKMCSF